MNDSTAQSRTAAPGWYPVDGQQERYWTGTEWSDQLRQVAANSAPVNPVRETASNSQAVKPAWFRRGWVIAVASLLLGMILGAASTGGAEPTDSNEYKALAAELQEAKAAAASADEQLAEAKDELEQVVGDLPAREDAVTEAEAAVTKREKAAARSEAKVRAASRAVAKREKAVGLVEKEIANNTIPGEGIFEVGVDMKPGMYKSAGSADCYFAVLGDANGNDIKSNNLTSGPATVSVSEGEYFETNDCAQWVLQR